MSLSMKLGLARLDLPPGSPAETQVAEAHEEARRALAELRELIRGVHPQVLTDRGLGAAVQDVAGRSPVPVHVDVWLPGRLPSPIEVTAYYVVSEAMANIAKHSRARRGFVHGRLHDGTLVLEVGDDGVGGADPAAGSGLAGLADRVAVTDGVMTLSSPPGGPTSLRVEIPCPVSE
ncbi:histidine kinase [Nonomuraea sp. B12E4]|uniref:sensor histidine kinase n=1 Tax=Nonomuraea sp. B12E4 TaxID=3153564 RepID=UPI00325E2105